MSKKKFLLVLSTVFVMGACSRQTTSASSQANPNAPAVKTAIAEVKDSQGAPVGTAKLQEVPGGVRVMIELKGLPPGTHGAHIHENGKCDSPAFTTAGGHFNPLGKEHGSMNPKGEHVGDLGNVQVGQGGNGTLDAVAKEATLNPSGKTSLLGPNGTAIVIHADPDDLKSNPAGNAGKRIACGVITVVTQ